MKSGVTKYVHTSSKKYPIIVGQKYDYTVKAYNQVSGKYSTYDTKGLTVKTVPETPQLVKAVVNSDNTVTVSWKKQGAVMPIEFSAKRL